MRALLTTTAALLVAATGAGCASGGAEPSGRDVVVSDGTQDGGQQVDQDGRPTRITIRPDDYHVPYAGTAEDGRRFFLSQELFAGDTAYVGLFLWTADGEPDSVRATAVPKPEGAPIGQAVPAGADALVEEALAQLGDYTLEPITVAPFVERIDGVPFGFRASELGGSWSVNVEPGDFIAYYAPWDGYEYDT